MKFKFNHSNITISDEKKSLEFYKLALGLEEVHRQEFDDCFMIYLQCGNVELELRLNKNSSELNLGNNPTHLAFSTDDYISALKKHREMNCIDTVIENLGIHFIKDPDGYIIEVIPENFFEKIKNK